VATCPGPTACQPHINPTATHGYSAISGNSRGVTPLIAGEKAVLLRIEYEIQNRINTYSNQQFEQETTNLHL
jgi:hypothetical protein